jgi:hypothetical protein
MDKHKLCKYCNELKSTEDFYLSQRTSRCKKCFLEFNRDYKRKTRKNDEFRKLEGIKQKERRFRLWQNTLINDSKSRKLENTLTTEDIDEMFEKQKGLCFWFKVPLVPANKSKHPQQPSLDRLDRKKGYVKDNVVLTCYSANIGRNETDLKTWVKFVDTVFSENKNKFIVNDY